MRAEGSSPLSIVPADLFVRAPSQEFMGKLKKIEGTSQHETQEITFVKL